MRTKNKQDLVINTIAEVIKLSGVEGVRITVATDRLTSAEGKSSFSVNLPSDRILNQFD
jgi:hypothetical protein